jgi:hypothetical protein
MQVPSVSVVKKWNPQMAPGSAPRADLTGVWASPMYDSRH